MHTLKLTQGLRLLIHNLLYLGDTVKTPGELLTAGLLVEKLDCPIVTASQATEEWKAEKLPDLELSERQRDLLKAAVTRHVAKLPPDVHAVSLLQQLGFE